MAYDRVVAEKVANASRLWGSSLHFFNNLPDWAVGMTAAR